MMFRACISMLLAALLSACPSRPKYPSCETDLHCQEDEYGAKIAEYCVNHQCQQCKDDGHCQAGMACKAGRCERKSECPCASGMVCENDKCYREECQSDGDCPAPRACRGSRCVPPSLQGCSDDDQCPEGMRCASGKCETPTISQECMPQSEGGDEIVRIATIQFEFDQSELTLDSRRSLERAAECVRQLQRSVEVVVEGHCDERGTQEYNLALGEKRATTVRQYLVNLGIDAGVLRSVSKGENEPVCYEADEGCYARNRRVRFIQVVR
jgi:peptidoglycan-associated lipoprotein